MIVRSVGTYVLLFAFEALSLTNPERVLAQPKEQPPQVRMKWQDFVSGPNGARRLASLEKAITKMKSLDNSADAVDFRRSWTYWANIHGYYGPESRDGKVEDLVNQLKAIPAYAPYVPYFDGIVDQQLPKDGVAEKVWATCQHSMTDDQGNLIMQADFWGWHRMYLYYFERVLRWAAQDDTLRLPYWDYTDPAYTMLPAEFQKLDSVLYDAKRSPLVNKGTPLDKDSTNADAALNEPNYLAAEWNVESGVHGNVHCETVAGSCPIAYMGDVPVAANDPIFYAHHANIDRLWACWQNSYPPVEGESWLKDQFSFPDEAGTLQTRLVTDFISTAALGYVYDNVRNCLRKPPRTPMRTMALQLALQLPEESSPMLIGSASSVSLAKPSTSVDIVVPQRAMLNFALPETRVSTVLVLRQISAQSPPGAVLKVYVAAKGKPGLRKYVATINWFNAFGALMKGPNVKTMVYDVSDQLKELGISTGTDGLTVTFEAATGLEIPPASARAAALASFRPEAKLTIGAVELRQPASPQ